MDKVSIARNKTTEWDSFPLEPGQVAVRWLGQAGFAFRYGQRAFLIDPYLSDSLAAKYKGREFPHVRMMEIPVDPAALHGLDWVFCSHRHTDHMDPGTLPVIHENNPACRFIVPAATADYAAQNVPLPGEVVRGVDAGRRIELDPDIHVDVIASAHEELAFNDSGQSEFLGFIFQLASIRVYHAGDCAAYEGLEQSLSANPIDLAIMPVNGRDELRASRGVPGNFHFDEALQICRNCNIPTLIPCHFGMFAFNTVDESTLKQKARAASDEVQVIIPKTDGILTVSRQTQP